MIFSRQPLDEAEGAILAHGAGHGAIRLKKGHRLSAEDVAALRAAGETSVVVARLEEGDVPEDEAAKAVAAACAGPGVSLANPFTGRCNLHASAFGLVVVDAEAVDRLNLVDEAITIATLPPFDVVRPGQMVATVKLIPFAAPASAIAACQAIASGGLVRVAAFQPRQAGLVITTLPGIKLVEKTRAVIQDRLANLGSRLIECLHCDHDEEAVADAIGHLQQAGCDLIMVLGASAVVDREDVIPAAIGRCGGRVEFFGMPVDPGNLLLLGHLDSVPVIGMPGCARSPKLNGADFVLRRILAGLPVTRAEVARMGVGGLLEEIDIRPQLRDEEPAPVVELTAEGTKLRRA